MGLVFISYRRVDREFAQRLTEHLRTRLEDEIFIDTSIDQADWLQALNEKIRACHVFLLAVTEHTFDPKRIHIPTDWIQREVALSLTLDKPVVLAIRNGELLPLVENLPPTMQLILNKQGKIISDDSLVLYNASLDDLAAHCVKISNGALRLRSKPSTSQSSNNMPQNHAIAGNESIILQEFNNNNGNVSINNHTSGKDNQ